MRDDQSVNPADPFAETESLHLRISFFVLRETRRQKAESRALVEIPCAKLREQLNAGTIRDGALDCSKSSL